MKWKNLHTPNTIELDEATASDRYGKFTIEPLERGFGLTIGNSLRRVLLSSLQGAATTAVKIEGVLHEFSTIPGVLEDVSEIILNLKQMRFKLHADYKINARFKKSGPGELKAGDLQADPGVEILNPDLHIATLNKDGEIDMEVEIAGGRGYVPADQQDDERPIGVVPVDAHFSPIKKVNFEVEATRVGQRVDFDKLDIELWTDGSILPKDAISYAAMILKDHFSMFVDFEEPIEREVEEEEDKEISRIRDLMEKSVEELELSVRSANCLRAAGIKTIGELVQKSESAMLKYRNFGRKSLREISDILGEMSLHFGMDVTPYAKKEVEPSSEFESDTGTPDIPDLSTVATETMSFGGDADDDFGGGVGAHAMDAEADATDANAGVADADTPDAGEGATDTDTPGAGDTDADTADSADVKVAAGDLKEDEDETSDEKENTPATTTRTDD